MFRIQIATKSLELVQQHQIVLLCKEFIVAVRLLDILEFI